MTRLNLILLLVLILTALGTVSSQHKARKLYYELEKEETASKQYAVEWGQLQLEQSTWGNPSRIEKIASDALKMQVPNDKQIQIVKQHPKETLQENQK